MENSSLLKSNVEKPEKFKGSDFRRWQQKMLFYLTTLKVSNVLTDQAPTPPVGEGENAPSQIELAMFQRSLDIWNANEYNCRNFILNGLDDGLYDIYSSFTTAREIWESLESKYKTEVACSKRFIVGKFLNFKMTDSKPVVKQVEEMQILVHELEVEGMGINSNFVIGSIIDKLPPSWKNFKLYLKHLSEDMSFEQLILKLRVEEDNRMNEKADAISLEPNANMVTGNSSNSKFQKGKGKATGFKHHLNASNPLSVQRRPFKKRVMSCWVCGKPGHRAKDCRHRRDHGGPGGGGAGGNPHQANVVNAPNQFVGVIEAFMVTNVTDWWVDTGATKHICNSKNMFATYQKVDDEEPMYMGNATTAKVEGKGKVILKLTSGKELVLTNVLHVPAITKNLISGPTLSNKGFKMVFESDKFVITKGGMYVGKGYLNEGLFKLSVMNNDDVNTVNVVNSNKTAGSSSASMYMLDSSSLWHSRLGHVNF